MKRAWVGIALSMLLVGSQESPATAGPNTEAKVVLHISSPTPKSGCGAASRPDLRDIRTNGDLYPAECFVYLLVVDGDPMTGVAGFQCGIRYLSNEHQGVDVYGWQPCATVDFPSNDWPASGSGNMIFWDNSARCPNAGIGSIAVAGYFHCTAYGPDIFSVIEHPGGRGVTVADCSLNEERLLADGIGSSPLGYVAFSSGAHTFGYNPLQSTGPNETQGSSEANPDPLGMAATSPRTFPNPAALTAGIEFNLTVDGPVEIEIYDIAGRLVSQMNAGRYTKGTHRMTWDLKTGDGRDLPNGVYHYRVRSSGGTRVGRLLVAR